MSAQGWRHERIRGDTYDRFIDKYFVFEISFLFQELLFTRLARFVQLVRKYIPHCLLHFEDFGVTNAQRLLELYRGKHSVFNDDMYISHWHHS